MSKLKTRYFLDRDNSGHWYVIPTTMRKAWNEWCALDEDDEASWDAPEFAKALGGSPSLLTFSEPTVGDKGLQL